MPPPRGEASHGATPLAFARSSGIQTSVESPEIRKSGRATPTIVYERPLSVTWRPTSCAIAAEGTLPEAAADDGDGRPDVGVADASAGGHRFADRLEEARRHAHRVERLDAPVGVELELRGGVPGDRCEGARAVAPVVERRSREIRRFLLAGEFTPSVEDDQPRRVAVGERPQQDAVDEAEDGGVGADAERERQDRRRREPRRPQEREEGVANFECRILNDEWEF